MKLVASGLKCFEEKRKLTVCFIRIGNTQLFDKTMKIPLHIQLYSTSELIKIEEGCLTSI